MSLNWFRCYTKSSWHH